MLKRGFNGALTILHPFKYLILYSTSATSKNGVTNPTMAEYLVNSVGFSQGEAVSIVNKVSNRVKSTASIPTNVSVRIKSSKKPELVVEFLKNSGFDATQIRKVVSVCPFVLHKDVDKTLKPKIRAFEDLGLRGSDLGLVISQHPYVLNRSLKAHIVPSLESLKSVIGNNEQLISFLLKTKSPHFLSYNVIKNLPQNMLLLQSYGVPREKIKQLILQRPLMLMQRTQWLEKKIKAAEEKLGIPRTSAMFLHGVSALSMISEDRLEGWLQVLRNYGWGETEISALLRRHPLILNMSVKLLMVRLNYFMEELGYGSDYLASRPAILTYSMEKRIVPRTAVIEALKEKQLLKNGIRLYSFLCYAESKFVERFVIPFKDKLPQLYEDYMQKTSSSGVSLSKS